MNQDVVVDDVEMDAITFQIDEREAAQTGVSDAEELPEQTKEQLDHNAAVAEAIRNTPVKGGDDWAGQLARNQALDKVRGGRAGNPVAGGRLPEDDPDFIKPDWGHLKYDPKPATGFSVTAKRRRLSTEEIAKRRAQLEKQIKLLNIVAAIRERLSWRVTPRRDQEIGAHLREARELLDRGAWDAWIVSIPMSRSASFAFIKAASD